MGFDNPTTEALVHDLNEQLEKARKAYYKDASPIMSDAEYDALEAKLRGVVKSSPWLATLATTLNTVGSDLSNGNGRVKHARPMLSIENQYTKDDVVKFVLDLPAGSAVCVEPKRDGISCELTYLAGILERAVTRGTGTEGEDMTSQVKALKTIPHTLKDYALTPNIPSDLRIRGELVMRDGELNRLNDEAAKVGGKTYASTRNLTAGTMKQKDLSVVASREILFVPWDVYSPDGDAALPDSNYERMEILNAFGFPAYAGIQFSGTDIDTGVKAAINSILILNSKSDIRADGVVIKVDSNRMRRELGVASKFTNWMTCFKPQSASGTTYLRSIAWQIGRQGKLTPVATCDPVILAGASVTRATLNNETWIATMGLTLGAKVEMLRSGDVIPQIVKVLDDTGEPIIPPTTCPECASTLTVSTDDNSGITTRWCDNGECPGRARDFLSYVGSRDILEIDGLADDMANRLVTNKYARNLGELFEFQADAMDSLNLLKTKYGEEEAETQFLNRAAKQGFNVLVLRMVKSMENAKTAPWDKWIAAFGIPYVGRTLGKLLAKELKLEENDMPNLCAKLEAAADSRSIEGLGDVKSDILKKWSLDKVNRDICASLFNSGVRPKPLVVKTANVVGQPLAGVAFCITGTFDEDRDSLVAKLESLGAVEKGVSKKLTHLIVGEEAGKSKLLKYDELVAKGAQIQKVGKDWLMDTLEAAGIGMKRTGFVVEEV